MGAADRPLTHHPGASLPTVRPVHTFPLPTVKSKGRGGSGGKSQDREGCRHHQQGYYPVGGAGRRAPCPQEAAHRKRAADCWLSAPHSPATTRQDLHLLWLFPLPPSPSAPTRASLGSFTLSCHSPAQSITVIGTHSLTISCFCIFSRGKVFFLIFITLPDLPCSCPQGHIHCVH